MVEEPVRRIIKQVDPAMKQTYLNDYSAYLQMIKLLETRQIDAEEAIEQLQSLLDDINDDIFIMDQDAYEFFKTERTKLGLENKEKKEHIRLSMKDPDDVIDERNQKRLLLKYDVEKHRKTLAMLKQLSNTKGWFR